MPEDEPVGLRERKRLATRQAIQRAVLELALDRGLEHVTVEDVSRQADISPRTFFNYFVSKEAAIAGDAPEFPGDDLIDTFVSGGPNGDILLDIGDLMATGADISNDSRKTVLLRRELHTKYPQMFVLRMASMRVFEEQLAEVIARRLVHDSPALGNDAAALDSRARLITFVAFGAFRHAWDSWANQDTRSTATLADQLRESFAQLDGLLMQTSAA